MTSIYQKGKMMKKAKDRILVGLIIALLFLSIGCVRIPLEAEGPDRVRSLQGIAKRMDAHQKEEINSIAYEVRYTLPEAYYEESYGVGPVPEDFTASVLWEGPNKFRVDIRSVYNWSGVPLFKSVFRRGMEASYASFGSNGEDMWILRNETTKALGMTITLPREAIKVEPSPYTDMVLQLAPLLEPYSLLEQFLPLIGMGFEVKYQKGEDVSLEGRLAYKYKIIPSEILSQDVLSQILGQTEISPEILGQPQPTGEFGNLSYEVLVDSETWFPIKLNLYEKGELISAIECKNIEINPPHSASEFEVPEGVRVRSQPMKTPYDMQVFLQRLLSLFYYIAPPP
jgi:outer membrane lipoprotein-sorting protein